MRLQKYLAMCGIASRRKCEVLITEGRVTVNGRTVKELGTKVEPSKDHVKVDGKVVNMVTNKVYILMNKPSGIVTTSSDQFDRKTVIDLLEGKVKERVYPVGRLDYDTEGLIILTNDGEFANSIIHPKYKIRKRYQVVIRGMISEEALSTLKSGVEIDSGTVSMDSVKMIKFKKEDTKTELEVSIHEGKNRQIRKMFEAVGFEVIYLKRVSIGNLSDKELKRGEWRHLTVKEVRDLKSSLLTKDGSKEFKPSTKKVIKKGKR